MPEPILQPVYPEYFADPYVWQHEGVYYAVGTSEAAAVGGPHPDDRVIPLLRSTNLRDWEYVHNVLLRPDLALGGEFWAPAVVFRDGTFYLYCSVGQGSACPPTRRRSCVPTRIGSAPERDLGDRRVDWHTVEGAAVVRRHGRYYCFFSGSAWQTESYGVDYATADHPLGPYHSDAQGDEAPRVLRHNENLRGPGHCMIVIGPDGATDHIVFHAWDGEMKRRQMYVEPLFWTERGPRLAAFAKVV